MRARVVVALMLAPVALAVGAACDDLAAPQRCTNIPAGGCPLVGSADENGGTGITCEDPTCAAVYACRPGDVWDRTGSCPVRDAGAHVDGGHSEPAEAAAPPFDASIDAPPGAFGGPGCPSLQTPDCALGVVLGCGGCCGCEDLFVCEDDGWTLWGSCADGRLVPGK
jgi:hypothetical protein